MLFYLVYFYADIIKWKSMILLNERGNTDLKKFWASADRR